MLAYPASFQQERFSHPPHCWSELAQKRLLSHGLQVAADHILLYCESVSRDLLWKQQPASTESKGHVYFLDYDGKLMAHGQENDLLYEWSFDYLPERTKVVFPSSKVPLDVSIDVIVQQQQYFEENEISVFPMAYDPKLKQFYTWIALTNSREYHLCLRKSGTQAGNFEYTQLSSYSGDLRPEHITLGWIPHLPSNKCPIASTTAPLSV